MSSVSGSSGGNRNDEVTRRNREDYQSNEAELVKKHNREVRRLTEAHQAEMRKLKEIHEQQTGSLQSRSREAITTRDRRYQQEMENLKAVHRQQVQKLMSENEEKMARHREAIDSEKTLFKAANEHRVEDLSRSYMDQLNDKDETFRRSLEEVREDQAEAIARQRENFERKHKTELDALEKTRTDKLGDLQAQYRTLQTSADRRLRNQEIRHFQDRQRMSETHIQDRNELQGKLEENQEILREGFEDGLKTQRERFAKAEARNREAQEEISEDLSASVNDRVEGQIRRLEAKIRELKDVNVRNQLESKRRAQNEIRNIQEAYQKKIDNYKGQKDMAVEQFNDRNAADIAKVKKENDEILRTNHRFYKDRIEVDNLRHKTAFSSVTSDLKAQNEQQKKQADMRVANIIESTGRNEQRLRGNFEETVDSIRESNQDEKRDLTMELMRQRDEAIQRVKEQMSKSEMRNEERMADTINRYEKRLAELQDRHNREKRLTDVQQKRTFETLKKAHQSELDATKAQYEEKLAKTNEQHRSEMENINRRHEAKMDQVLQNLRKT